MKIIVASAALGGVAYGTWYVLDDALGVSLLAQIVSVGGALALGSAVYAALVLAMRIPEARQILELFTRRLRAARLSFTPVADQAHIRNFSIIAHIDHGKSTLADRILELTHTVDPRSMRAQLLDSMDLERERGITIKAQAVRVFYTARDGEHYQFHLIDTPGHVDFTYEVSRSLAACEGALLVVDASQGVEAQTVANTYLAIDSGLELIPAMNKVDLPGAEPDRVGEEIAELIGEPAEDVRRISAKTGEGVEDLLEELVKRVPPPHGDPDAPPRALIFDSEFDQYRGVIAYIRVVDGTFKKGEAIRAMAAGTEADIDDIGYFTPAEAPADELHAGEVGYLITGIKDVSSLRVGDTLTTKGSKATEALPGYRDVKPMVFCGLFPMNNDDYPELRDALEKLTLNDAALSWEPETSDALGFGFRCGFLGLLHMDIVRERLEREYDLELMATMPSVEFEITLTDGSVIPVHNPTDMPDPARIAEVREPYIRASILAPKEFIGQIMELCQDRRGVHNGMHYLSSERVQITYDLPLAEIVLDFFDQLKTRTRGYASLDYEPIGLRASALVKLDVLLGGDPVDALSMVVHRDKAYDQGKVLTERLRKKIPRQQYDVPIQAAVGAKIIARETVKAFRKDVTAKCYGGDISRKRKLLEKQKEGKRRMKQVGRIEVPQEAFLAVLELGDERMSDLRGRAARRSASTRTRWGRPTRATSTPRRRARRASPTWWRRRCSPPSTPGRPSSRRSWSPAWTSPAWSTAPRSSPGTSRWWRATRSPPRRRWTRSPSAAGSSSTSSSRCRRTSAASWCARGCGRTS